jgi:hypothetical protein
VQRDSEMHLIVLGTFQNPVLQTLENNLYYSLY